MSYYYLHDAEAPAHHGTRLFDSPYEVFWNLLTPDEWRVGTDDEGVAVRVFHMPEWDDDYEVEIPITQLPDPFQELRFQRGKANRALETIFGGRYSVRGLPQ